MSYSVEPPSCWDACCTPGRNPEEFDPEESVEPLTTEDLYVLLANRQTGIMLLVGFQGLILVLWLLTSFVPGFVRFDGAVGEASAINHMGWWIVIEGAAFAWGLTSTGFGINYNKHGFIEKGVQYSIGWLRGFRIASAIAVIANLVHFALSIVENANCTSTFCTQERGFLITFIVILCILAFVNGWLIYRTTAYISDLESTLAYRGNNFVLMGPEHNRPRRRRMQDDDEDELPQPSAPPMNPAEGLETPLLKAIYQRHGSKRSIPYEVPKLK